MSADEVLGSLRRVRDGLTAVARTSTQTVLDNSLEPGLMELAFAGIEGRVSGEDGRRALREALQAEGMSDTVLDSIDALYVRCLLDPTL